MKYVVMAAFVCFSFCACEKKSKGPGLVDAYVPVYGNQAELKIIAQQAAQPILNGGKIATIANYLFQVEDSKGIHVINISNPAAPQKLSFIKIPLCSEVTLRGNLLYTNNANDLLVLDISNISNITVLSRTENAFPIGEVLYPPDAGVYFECADASKGPVIGWELKKVNNPSCKR